LDLVMDWLGLLLQPVQMLMRLLFLMETRK